MFRSTCTLKVELTHFIDIQIAIVETECINNEVFNANLSNACVYMEEFLQNGREEGKKRNQYKQPHAVKFLGTSLRVSIAVRKHKLNLGRKGFILPYCL